MTTFPGVERLLVAWLTGALGVRVVTTLPADLTQAVPLLQVTRIGGPHDDSVPSLQIPTVDIDAFGTDEGAVSDLLERVDVSLRYHLPGATVLGGRVGKVRTLSGSAWRAWENTDVRRRGASYQLWVKTPPPAL